MLRDRAHYWARAIVVIGMLVLQSCAARSPSPYAGLTPPQARSLAHNLADQRDQALRDDLRTALLLHRPQNILILSGGDAHGAFGCGVLRGWRDFRSSPRPRFDIVTGVSTGAFIATFAFLGEPADDAVLREVYLKIHDSDVFDGPIGGPPDALFDTAPLSHLIERHVTADVVKRIAAAHRQGRRLYVATVELDTGALFIWPMSQLADRAVSPAGAVDPAKLHRFQQILLASASIPVLFPPVEIDGGMHVDAGLRAALFLHEAMLGINDATRRPAARVFQPPTVWMIFNGSLDPAPQPVTADLLDVGARSLEIYTHAVELLNVREVAYMAQRHEPPCQFCWICEPASDVAENALGPMFDPLKTNRLYGIGERMGRSGAWQAGPPASDEPDRTDP